MHLMESDFIVRLILAAILGALLGLERSLAGKHAGIRTYALVSMGSCLFTVAGVLAAYDLAVFASINPLQLAGFVIVGIGFIGSGLAVVGNHVELTTATGIWVAAGIGLSAGLGYWGLATAATILGLLIFSLLAKGEHALRVRWGNNVQE